MKWVSIATGANDKGFMAAVWGI